MRYSVKYDYKGYPFELSASTYDGLCLGISEAFGIAEEDIKSEETDDGDMLHLPDGTVLGPVEFQPFWPASNFGRATP